MYEEHEYKFFPSILRTSRQIEREASHVLYAENDLIRVSFCGLLPSRDFLGRGSHRNGHAVPILATDYHAHSFTRHMMEIVMLREIAQPERGSFDAIDRSFVIAGDDLQSFCHTLLVMNRYEITHLDQMTLAIEVYTEGTAAVTVPFESGENPINGEGLVRGDISIENGKSTKGDALINNENLGNKKISIAGVAIMGSDAISLGNKTNSVVHSPRVLRLLAPLHKLHSLHGVYIEGSISDDYKTALLSSMLGPPPSDQAMFDVLLDRFEDAIRCYETGEQDAALAKVKLTQDTLKDQKYIRSKRWDGSALLSTGPYAGYSVRDAERDIEVQVWTKLAWACLEVGDEPHILRANDYVSMITFGRLYKPNSYWSESQRKHKLAMTCYLEAHVDEAIGNIRYAHRARYISDAVHALQVGIQHESETPKLERKLRECRDELRRYRDMEDLILDLMEMWERLNETDRHAPSP